jgi:PAS domain S-box-containing protein
VTKRNKDRDPPVRTLERRPVTRAKGTRRILPTEAEETINAIRAGQVDALVIQRNDSDELYAVRSFDDLKKVEVELQNEGSARRRSEAARHETEKRFETLARHAPVGIYIGDAAGNCTFLNRCACEIIGLSLEDAIGQGWTKALHPDDRDDVLKRISQVVSSDRVVDLEFRFRHRDGQIVWVAARTIAIQREDGMVTGSIGTLTDITAHKVVELALQDANERMQVILDASPVAIISVDRAGRILAWSQGAERMFGWNEKEVIGRINPTVPDAEMGSFREKIRRVSAGGTFKGQLRRRKTKSGSIIRALISARPLPDRSGVNNGIVIIVDDITEQERANDQLRVLEEQRERFFQDMHDGCIQAIYAVGLNLEACRPLIDGNPTKAAQIITAASANLDLVIQDLRSFMTERGQQLPAARNLRAEIERAVQAAEENGLAFALDIDAAVEDALTPEQAFQLLQIAREVISNANRHANARSGQLSLRARDAIVCFEVADDGVGFDTTALGKSGMGLHHINARARKLGGRTQVVSASGRGTRVVVEIPLKR